MCVTLHKDTYIRNTDRKTDMRTYKSTYIVRINWSMLMIRLSAGMEDTLNTVELQVLLLSLLAYLYERSLFKSITELI